MENSNSWVDFTLTRGPIRGEERNKVGLVLKIKAKPDVEHYFAGLARNNYTAVDAYGDGWYTVNSDKPLMVYDSPTDGYSKLYTLNNVGQPLLISQEDRLGRIGKDEQLNLSFLKLVGIGSEDGVSVGFAGAYSADYVQRVRGLLGPMVKQFLHDYLVPITINLSIVNKA